jgi:hypothetical protein
MSKSLEIALRSISVRPTEVGEELSNVSLICRLRDGGPDRWILEIDTQKFLVGALDYRSYSAERRTVRNRIHSEHY